MLLRWIRSLIAVYNKPQQEGVPTKPGYKKLFILILQKTSNNNQGFLLFFGSLIS